MLVPSTSTNEVRPPSGGGAATHHRPPRSRAVVTSQRTSRVRESSRGPSAGARTDGAAGSCAVRSMLARAIIAAGYWAATTVSCVAATAVACGDVVLQVTLPAAFAHVYHEPAGASCTLSVLVVVGEIVNATWSRLVGVVAFSVYETFVIV